MADSTRQHSLRVPPDLMDEIDVRAKSVGLSRNEWIVRAMRWALAQPVRTTTVTEKL